MTKKSLGEFEHQVLLATLRLDGTAYSGAIMIELEQTARRDVAPAAVYIALRRLEDAGFVTSRMRDENGSAGLRERRYFTITRSGMNLLRTSREQLLALWHGVEPRLGRAR